MASKKPDKGSRINRKETIEEDPIEDDDDIETATSSKHRQLVTTPVANPRVEVKKPAPYVPTFGKGKGKVKLGAGSTSDFKRASSITVSTISLNSPNACDVADSP